MRHTLRLNGIIIGHSDLEHTDRFVGRAWGRFRPGLGYDLVQPIFRLFSEAQPKKGPTDDEKLTRYYKARDALPLVLLDETGAAIATSTIHIADYGAERASTIELDVLIRDEGYWNSREPK